MYPHSFRPEVSYDEKNQSEKWLAMHRFLKVLLFLNLLSGVSASGDEGSSSGETVVGSDEQQQIEKALQQVRERLSPGVPRMGGGGGVTLSEDEIENVVRAMRKNLLSPDSSPDPSLQGKTDSSSPLDRDFGLNETRIVEINGEKFAKALFNRLHRLMDYGTAGLVFLNELSSSEDFNPEKITNEDHFNICSAFKPLRENVKKFIMEIKDINDIINSTESYNYQFTDFFFGHDFIFNHFIFVEMQNTLGATFCDFSFESIYIEEWTVLGLSPTNLRKFINSQKSLVSRLNQTMIKAIGDTDQYSGESIIFSLDGVTLENIRDYVILHDDPLSLVELE